MLILARKEKESILIDGGIEIIIQEIGKDSVKVAIIAPKEVKVFRKELIDSIKSENINALQRLEKNQLKSYFTVMNQDNE